MKTIDGPKTPQWLQKIQWTMDSLSFMDAAVQRYGDIFNAPVIGNTPTVLLVSNPQALQQIFASDTKQFTAPTNQLLQPLVGNHSLFVLEGDRHRRERKLLMPPFHGDRMRAYGQLMVDVTEKAFAQLVPNQCFRARQVTQDISMDVILKVVFGLSDTERFGQLKQQITALTDAFGSPLVGGFLFFPSLQKDLGSWSPWGYICQLQRQIDQLLYAEIRDRRQNYDSSRTDILSLLLSARDEVGEGMTDVELHDELITLLLAGHETTATAIAWALYWVHKFPKIRAQLLQELETLGNNPDPLSIVRLPYLTAVCNETLRIYPVGVLTVPRAVKEPVELMGYQLEPGTRLYGCIYLTHHREDIYPNSKEFKPERFLERQFSPYEFLPFGGGSRRCIGEALALFEMKLVLATILQRYELELADQHPERPKRRGATFAPDWGVKMVMRSQIAK
ncbi:MAG TPA: cytochrome P450 [Cyanobacteria bacterium UBA8803]|nr:cytochrome P450 [Cyanobacteria bacterium UBA8803]